MTRAGASEPAVGRQDAPIEASRLDIRRISPAAARDAAGPTNLVVVGSRRMGDDLWEREETRPTAMAARTEAFRTLAESLADRLDGEAQRRSKVLTALDRQMGESLAALARRARVIASRFAAWPETAPWDASMHADVEAYFEIVGIAKGHGIDVHDAGPPPAAPAT